ncbi:MAG: hypothetical protein LAO03_00480 [Acidobacteriia bacterium]|nr:hypothetical protein [Terriglobia bacterium]
MNWSPIRATFLLPILVLAAAAQTPSNQVPAPPAAAPPVAYSSVSQLNLMLSQLEQASQAAQLDLAKLRIERWKTDSNTKRQEQANIESLQRNLQSALPEIIAELRLSPENLTSTFKLYRNLDALYDVFGSVVESTGAFGSKDEFQSLENDLTALEKSRRSFADRMETLAGAKEVELTRLRSEVRTAQAATPATAPKKVIVDDNEPPKKPAKKKAPAKPSTSTTPAAAPPK